MTLQERLASAANRIATATSVLRVRAEDHERAERNGVARPGLEATTVRLEAVAAELWDALDLTEAREERRKRFDLSERNAA